MSFDARGGDNVALCFSEMAGLEGGGQVGQTSRCRSQQQSSYFLQTTYMMCFHFWLFFFKLFIYAFLAALGLCHFTRVFSSYGEWGLLFFAVCWLLIHCSGPSCCGAQASVVVARGPRSCVVVAQGLICSTAYGILLDQVSNPYPLHWQADS